MAPVLPNANGVQKKTFLPYELGIPPEDLRLGSLYIDPMNPTDGKETTRCEFMEEATQEEYEQAVSKWTRRSQEPKRPFAIEFQRRKAKSLGLSFTDYMSLNGAKSEDSMLSIHGESGRRVKIRKPEAFLQEVMKQPGVQGWIREHASIVRKGKHDIYEWRAPKIWMVTGVQYVTGGTMHSQNDISNTVGGKAGGDPSLAAGAPPGTLSVKAEGNREHTNGNVTDLSHDDELVWAAQFMPVSIEFEDKAAAELSEKTGLALPRSIYRFRLQEVGDLGINGARAPTGGSLPGLFGNVTIQRSEDDGDDLSDESDGFDIDDTQYVADQRATDWERYNECKNWLQESNARRRQDSAAVF